MVSPSPSPERNSRRRSAKVLQGEWLAWTGSFAEFMTDLDERKVPYLSHSKIATVERCPRCYYKQYILGEQPSSDALTTGLLFHQAAAALYEARRDVRRGAQPADVDPPVPQHPSPDEQPYLDNALATLTENVWEGHEVIGVEELFIMDLAPRLPPVRVDSRESSWLRSWSRPVTRLDACARPLPCTVVLPQNIMT